tara:strand:+ start:162 stop:1139 length:978 start_codon:yes stop_codon:yes gene_type:complete
MSKFSNPGTEDLRGKSFEAQLKADRLHAIAKLKQDKINQHRKSSHTAGVKLFAKSMRRFRSQQIYQGFNQWFNQITLMKQKEKYRSTYNNASPDTQRKMVIIETVNEVQRVAKQSEHDRKVEAVYQANSQAREEASAAAAAASNPVNALAVLQERLANLFSDGAKRKSRLRRLHNLISAASRGDADRVAELLDDDEGGKVDINSQETDAGLCCLVVACINGSLNVVKTCCRRNASLELTDESGHSALMIAVKHKAITICRVLLANGANVNAANDVGDTSIHVCVRLANDCPEKLLMLLLNKGGNCEWPDSQMNTPLHVACCSESR